MGVENVQMDLLKRVTVYKLQWVIYWTDNESLPRKKFFY